MHISGRQENDREAKSSILVKWRLEGSEREQVVDRWPSSTRVESCQRSRYLIGVWAILIHNVVSIFTLKEKQFQNR